MKVTKCPKTITGKHIWNKAIWDINTGETSGSIIYTFPYEYIQCLACDMIDDRELIKKD